MKDVYNIGIGTAITFIVLAVVSIFILGFRIGQIQTIQQCNDFLLDKEYAFTYYNGSQFVYNDTAYSFNLSTSRAMLLLQLNESNTSKFNPT